MNGNSAGYTAIITLLELWPLLLVGYLLFGWSMARMAKRRGLAGWALGWFPMMNLWVMGSLCDQYQYVVYGKKRRSRVWLPILAVLLELLMVFGILGFQGDVGFVPALWATLMDVVAAMFLVGLYVCLYRLYFSSMPRKAVSRLVWSICLPVMPVFFLLMCKEQEKGMPVRRVMFRKELEWSAANPAPETAQQAPWDEKPPAPVENLPLLKDSLSPEQEIAEEVTTPQESGPEREEVQTHE